VTLALDSQALCCGTYVEDVLNQLRWEEFDIAFAVQVCASFGKRWTVADV